MLKTRELVSAAVAVAVAMTATGCGGRDYKHCSDLEPSARQQCLDHDRHGGGFFYAGLWYYGPRTLARPGFQGVRYSNGAFSNIGRAIGGFGESGFGSG
jgi:hypothetical protein